MIAHPNVLTGPDGLLSSTSLKKHQRLKKHIGLPAQDDDLYPLPSGIEFASGS